MITGTILKEDFSIILKDLKLIIKILIMVAL